MCSTVHPFAIMISFSFALSNVNISTSLVLDSCIMLGEVCQYFFYTNVKIICIKGGVSIILILRHVLKRQIKQVDKKKAPHLCEALAALPQSHKPVVGNLLHRNRDISRSQ